VTVLEVIQRSTEFLAKRGVESPRLQAELLLAHVLVMPRMKLYLNFERALTTAEADAMREMVKRRGLREPLQHIVGSVSFCGLELAVNRNVLIPRPETELLAEAAWEFLGSLDIQQMDAHLGHEPGGAALLRRHPSEAAQQRSPTSPQSRFMESPDSQLRTPIGDGAPASGPARSCNEIPSDEPGRRPALQAGKGAALDLCTGSGCLAIALAVKCPAARVVATDLSPEALAVAQANASRHVVAERIDFHVGDCFSAVPSGTRFDLIVSNPPYISSAEIATLEAEVRDHDPRLALDGGADGLEFYRRIAADGAAFLKPGGKLMLEFGDGQAGALTSLFGGGKWIVEAVKEDYSQRSRILVARAG
jgi:release factor glutamine methyltransferase